MDGVQDSRYRKREARTAYTVSNRDALPPEADTKQTNSRGNQSEDHHPYAGDKVLEQGTSIIGCATKTAIPPTTSASV